MYLYPDPDILNIIRQIAASKKIVKYADIPLQHVSPAILKSMKRGGGMDEHLGMIASIRSIDPEIAIRSSFIVGYPGETEADFEMLCEFMEKAGLNRAGFFAYSREEGTAAYDLTGKVPQKTMAGRIKKLAAIQEAVSEKALSHYIGKTLVCLNDGIVEEINEEAFLKLRSEYDAPEIDGFVLVKLEGDAPEETFIKVKITGLADSHDLVGENLGEA